MTLNRPLVMQAAGGDTAVEYSAQQIRELVELIYRSEGVVTHSAEGHNALKVSQRAAGANFSVDINSGPAVIAGDDVTNQMMYAVRSTAVENRPIPPPPGAGTRVHRVVAHVNDKLHRGSLPANTYDWAIEVLEDLGSGTPAIPNSAIALARVSVSAGQPSVLTSHITDDRIHALTQIGRYRYLTSDTDRAANPVEGAPGWRTDRKTIELWTGTAHGEIYHSAGGPAWPTYTPAWTASGSNPVLGNGIAAGRYMRTGRMITLAAEVTAGSTTSFGSGSYSLSLPVAAATAVGQFLHTRLFDVSADTRHAGLTLVLSATTATLQYHNGTVLSAVTPTAPFPWANGDSMRVFGTYEAAS